MLERAQRAAARSTRKASANTRFIEGTLHKTNPKTTASNVPSANARFIPSPAAARIFPPERCALRQRQREEVFLGLDRFDLRSGAVVLEHRAGAAANLEHASLEIPDELATHVGVALLVGLRRHHVRELGARVLLLQLRHLFADRG